MIKTLTYLILVFIIMLAAFYFLLFKIPANLSKDDSYLSTRVSFENTKDTLKDLAMGNLSSLLGTGDIFLDDYELSTIVQTSLYFDKFGKALMASSYDIQANILSDKVEIGVLMNSDDITQLIEDPNAKQHYQNTLDKFSFFQNKKIYIGIKGRPAVSSGLLVIDKNISFKIGAMPIPQSLLSLFGVDVSVFNDIFIDLKYVKLVDVYIDNINDSNQLVMSVRPNFGR